MSETRNVLIYDPFCPKPYTTETLGNEAMGGTEATVLRIAYALAQENWNVSVMQHNRDTLRPEFSDSMPFRLKYVGLGDHTFKPTSVVTLRDPAIALQNAVRWPNAKHFLWAHDVATPNTYPGGIGAKLKKASVTVITVSDWHRNQVITLLHSTSETLPVVFRIYNPVVVPLDVVNIAYDKNKLVFFSSPHKGLAAVLRLFEILRKQDPEFRLIVGNPGYIALPGIIYPDGVEILGPLPHSAMLAHVASSLCVFYPNQVFPETFGLVMAEANAVGTPVLTYKVGAATEVTNHPNECVSPGHYETILRRVMEWKAGARPKVKANPEFNIKEVISQWNRLLK